MAKVAHNPTRTLGSVDVQILEESSLHWTKVAEDTSLDDALRGEIRAAVGQAQLLHTKRVKQFLGLCDLLDDGPLEEVRIPSKQQKHATFCSFTFYLLRFSSERSESHVLMLMRPS